MRSRPPGQSRQEFLRYRVAELELPFPPIRKVVLAVEHQPASTPRDDVGVGTISFALPYAASHSAIQASWIFLGFGAVAIRRFPVAEQGRSPWGKSGIRETCGYRRTEKAKPSLRKPRRRRYPGVGCEAGWTGRLIEHLELLIGFTRLQDWFCGHRPILQVQSAAERLGLSASQIQRNERRLMQLGAVSFRDSGNFRRKHDAGGDLKARDEDGRMPLHNAAALSKTPSVVTALLDAGADPRAKNAAGEISWGLIPDDSNLKETDVYWRLNQARFE